jgi:hypothetical protein
MFIAAQWRENFDEPVRLNVPAAADYQLPKVLRAFRIPVYGEALARAAGAGRPVAAASAKERAIRAATVLACDRLAVRFGADIEAVDFWLWQQRNAASSARFQLAVTTHY